MDARGDAIGADVVVVGSGMAGMTAASRVAAAGSRVVVIEKAAELGGNAALSGGSTDQPPTRSRS